MRKYIARPIGFNYMSYSPVTGFMAETPPQMRMESFIELSEKIYGRKITYSETRQAAVRLIIRPLREPETDTEKRFSGILDDLDFTKWNTERFGLLLEGIINQYKSYEPPKDMSASPLELAEICFHEGKISRAALDDFNARLCFACEQQKDMFEDLRASQKESQVPRYIAGRISENQIESIQNNLPYEILPASENYKTVAEKRSKFLDDIRQLFFMDLSDRIDEDVTIFGREFFSLKKNGKQYQDIPFTPIYRDTLRYINCECWDIPAPYKPQKFLLKNSKN